MNAFMKRALLLGRQALGKVSPNPAVGAVVVKDRRIVGEGRTQPPPGPHAEVMALRQAGAAAKGAALYVSLEPCAHHGRTPPCTEAILAAGIREVHIPMLDPDLLVSGQGRAALQAAGVPVVLGEGEESSRRQLEAYIKHRTTGLPFVIAKFAVSLDGRIAAAGGESRWLSGPRARDWAHRLRAQVDAVIVGSGTVLADDPLLTARPNGRVAKNQPLRVVLDSRGRILLTARILDRAAPTLVVTSGDSPADWRSSIEAKGVEVLVLPREGEHVDLSQLARLLGERAILSVLVEGGGLTLGSFFDAGLVDKVHAVVTPLIIGADKAPAPIAGVGAQQMLDALRLADVSTRRLGPDILVTGYPQYPATACEEEANSPALATRRS